MGNGRAGADRLSQMRLRPRNLWSDGAMAQTIPEKAKIRQNREGDRLTEDDIARQDLGPRGEKGKPDTATMTEDSKLQTPSPLDPGHTS